MKILVMGGTRFVGKSLVGKLLSKNYEIDIFTRGNKSNPEKTNLIKGDRNNLEDIVQLRNEKYDVLHDGKNSHDLKNFKEISKLLQLVRNESHRFAINHHRKRRSKDLFSSGLDGIDGLGPKLKLNLIRFFGGIDKVIEASFEDLKSAPGIGEEKAKKIYSHLNNN